MKSAAVATPGSWMPVQGDSASFLSRTASARTALMTKCAQPIRLAGRGRRSEPPWPGARAFRRGAVVGTMNVGESDLFSGPCPWQRGHEMRAWQYGHGIQVPLPPQNADNS
jgi:hypothetical protein